jgi:hypothetical protein
MFLHRIPSLQNSGAAQSRRVIQLFRISLAFAFCMIAFVAPAAAQYPGQIKTAKTSDNPRAVAVLEFTGDPANPTASRLIPVSYFYAGAYQDAGIYMAQPAPVALLTGTEYELQRAGLPTALYDVETAGRIAETWIGFGDFKALRAERAKRAGASSDDDEGRPHLTKSASAAGSEIAAPDKSKPASDETATATNPSPLDDTNRPTLKRKATPIGQQQNVSDKTAAASTLDDPDRPRIQRGQPSQNRPGAKHLVGNPPDMQQLVAVSDATMREPHPFAYTWNSPEDQAHAEQKLTAAVQAALASPASLASPLAPAPSLRTSARATRAAKPIKGPTLTDAHITSYALTYENTPSMVLTAKTSGETPLSITAIAEVDIYNEPRILLTSVSDAVHRTDQPEMHLIDAVDADGTNRASLLFELRGTTDRQFALYRISRGTAVRTFVTGPVPYAPPIPAPSE